MCSSVQENTQTSLQKGLEITGGVEGSQRPKHKGLCGI